MHNKRCLHIYFTWYFTSSCPVILWIYLLWSFLFFFLLLNFQTSLIVFYQHCLKLNHYVGVKLRPEYGCRDTIYLKWSLKIFLAIGCLLGEISNRILNDIFTRSFMHYKFVTYLLMCRLLQVIRATRIDLSLSALVWIQEIFWDHWDHMARDLCTHI